MAGAGFLDNHADEVYRLEADDLYLTGTSEVALAGYHADEIIDLSRARSGTPAGRPATAARPGRTARTPAASSACTSSTRSRCSSTAAPRTPRPSTSGCSTGRRRCSPRSRCPTAIIDTAAGDLGGPAARKFDCEAWVPTQGRYRELTSTSNCTTYQARRLNTRERDPHGSGTRVVATLNGTLATTRWIVAILENHQQPDGSVVVPEALRPYLGLEVLTPAGE